MKTKKFSKKLKINKTTVANLSEHAMYKVKGGSRPGSYCPTVCGIISCPPEETKCKCPVETLDAC
ncbi:MAG: class I lanthipeptide [Candidatus Aminicenantes bacterium]|jgi:hypothetical protein